MPPGGKGTINFMGRVGAHCWAKAVLLNDVAARAVAISTLFASRREIAVALLGHDYPPSIFVVTVAIA